MSNPVPAPKANMGQPVPRVDGRLKVTGEARYAADVPVANPAYAFLVTSPIAKGRIVAFHLDEAHAVPGVLDILTYENAPGVRAIPFATAGGQAGSTIRPLESDRIWHDGQIIAVVLADSFEAAREAAYQVKFDLAAEPPSATFDTPGTQVELGQDVSKRHHDETVGDAEAAFATAAVSIDAQYSTPTQHHNPIELFATTCAWADGKLTIYEPSQFVYGLRKGVASQLGIDPQNVEVKSPFVGGAFGSKGSLTQRTALVALAAKRLNRPVKLVPTRDQGFTIASYRAETKQRVRLAAARDGKLTALIHEGWEVTSRPDPYLVGGTRTTTHMYASPNIATKVWIVHADRNTPGFMRSPPETPYMYALESAMDELAVKLGMDPVELRRINDTMTDPVTGKPYSSRSLMQCYDEASRAFGWQRRDPRPGSMRDGDWLVGWGCATACYPSQMGPAAVRIKLTRDGKAQVAVAAHEIGNGAYTVAAQMTAERLGLSLGAVKVELGDTDLPPGPVAGGSVTTASICSALLKGCDAIRARLSRDPQEKLEAAFDRLGVSAIEEYAEWVHAGAPPDAMKALYDGSSRNVGGVMKDHTSYAFGAEFVEVRIHALTREIRVPRIVGAFAAGHIVNPRTAHSQYMGAMIWGISSALHEATEIDRATARYINDNIADYLIPVNADICEVEVILVPEEDKLVNPAGIKGIGELANVGTAAAVANAVFHATGLRLRDLPIRIEHLLAA